jgi:hypothetical protein
MHYWPIQPTLCRAYHPHATQCKIGAALVPRERGPGLNPVPNVPEIGANISIKNCDYNLAPY